MISRDNNKLKKRVSSFDNLLLKCSYIIQKNLFRVTNTIDLEGINKIFYNINKNNFYLKLINKSYISFILKSKPGYKGKIEFDDEISNIISKHTGVFLITINKKYQLKYNEFTY